MDNAPKNPKESGRHQLLLLLLGLDSDGLSSKGITGITRLQKLLFLLWKEAGIESVDTAFDFKPYKAGPYSRKLYDELEFLENIGLIQSEIEGQASEVEAVELEEVSFEQLMGEDADPYIDVPNQGDAMTADTYEERRFTLTPRGLETARKILAGGKAKDAEDGVRRIKSRYSGFSLQDLLYHVYTKYEGDGWTSESEIRSKVLAKGSRR